MIRSAQCAVFAAYIVSLGNCAPPEALQIAPESAAPYKVPDFKGRDYEFSRFRTQIVRAMADGPNFAGHYTVVLIGCGAGCRIVIIADNESGQLHDFPYGGEEYYMLSLSYGLTSKLIDAKWIEAGKCKSVRQAWTGRDYLYVGDREYTDLRACYE